MKLASSLLLAIAAATTVTQVHSKPDDETCTALAGTVRKGTAMLATARGAVSSYRTKAKPLVVYLDRLGPVSLLARSGERTGVGTGFYVGNVTVGSPPQAFQMVFDTTSAATVLPYKPCTDSSCLAPVRLYEAESSSTFESVNVAGYELVMNISTPDLGSGSAIGPVVRDEICLSAAGDRKICSPTVFLAASRLADLPYGAMPGDGIFGLGLGVPLGSSPGDWSWKSGSVFFRSLLADAASLEPLLCVSLGPSGGKLYVGGHDPADIAAPFQWFPVHDPEAGYWQVPILAVRVGGKIVDDCPRGCHAIIDMSATRLGVLRSGLGKMNEALVTTRSAAGACDGPNLEFDLGGMSVVLSSTDYADASEAACTPKIGPLDLPQDDERFLGVYAFGEAVLWNYHVALNWKDTVMGFAPATESARARMASGEDKIFA